MSYKRYLNLKNLFFKSQNFKINFDFDENEFQNYKNNSKKKLIIGTACGRSGLRWISEIHSAHKNCIALIEPFPLHESFYRYATFNNLNIDHSSFFNTLKYQFIKLWKKYDSIIFSSPWVCFGLDEIEKNFQPNKYIFMFRDPKKVVNSLVLKGWYDEKIFKYENNKITGLQPNLKNFHHNFSRISPKNDYFTEWNNLTSVGKCSWFWSEANQSIYLFLKKVSKDKKLIFKLEDIDQNYNWYAKYIKYFDLEKQFSLNKFLELKQIMPNKGKKNLNIDNWNAIESKEFTKNTEKVHYLIENIQSDLV